MRIFNPSLSSFLEVESLEKVQEFMKDPDNAKVIEEAGVKIETQIMIPIIE